MSQVIGQADGLDQVFVGLERAGDGAAYPGHFDSMDDASAVVIPFSDDKYLRFVPQTAKGRGVNDPLGHSKQKRIDVYAH